METIKLIFSADHKMPKYAAVEQPAEASPSDYGDGVVRWYASAHPYGCSKNYRTPEDALTCMLNDHACFNIKVRRA